MNDAQETGNGGCIVTALIIIGLFIASFNGCRGCKEEKTAPPPKKETISQGEAVALGISALLIGIAAGSDNSSRKQNTQPIHIHNDNRQYNKQYNRQYNQFNWFDVY